jgi:hypothetical protein
MNRLGWDDTFEQDNATAYRVLDFPFAKTAFKITCLQVKKGERFLYYTYLWKIRHVVIDRGH